MHNNKILVIDDDRALCDLLAAIFSREGAATYAAFSGQQGLREFFLKRPDLVLLDNLMPGMNGLQVLQRIRELSDVPVIMLSAIDSQEEIIRCLRAGADDYVTKPYEPQLLLARANAAVRRGHANQREARTSVYDDGYIMFDLENRIVKVAGEDARLSATEFALLFYLATNAGRVCTFAQILQNVWGDTLQSSEENVHTFIYQLRQKLEPDPRNPMYLISVRSVGYRFQLPPTGRA